MHAAANGHVSIVDQLLRNRAKIDVVDKYGRTALYHAVKEEHNAVAQLLLKRGATVDFGGQKKESTLRAAVRTGNIDLVRQLLEHTANFERRSNSGVHKGDRNTPLHFASQFGKVNVMRYLLDNGAEVNARNPDQETPLHVAASRMATEASQLLIRKGASVDARSSSGKTPLHVAAAKRYYAFTINIGVSRTSPERLRYANNAMREQAAFVRLLIRNGADVEAMDAYGATALHYAVDFYSEQALMVLLEHGADVDVQAGDGKTALQMARNIGNDASVQMLIEFGAQDVEFVQDQPREEPA
jgi:ankyrin repeat protein